MTKMFRSRASVLSQKFVEEFSPRSGRHPAYAGPRRQPWGLSPPPSPRPLPRRAGEGEQKGVGGHLPQGLRPGLLYAAPAGAAKSRSARGRLCRRPSDSGH